MKIRIAKGLVYHNKAYCDKRIAKLEAEVERLQQFMVKECMLGDDCCPVWIEGGGRESGGGVGTSTQAVPQLDPAASANPAALLAKARAAERKKPRVQPPFRRIAARKERA